VTTMVADLPRLRTSRSSEVSTTRVKRVGHLVKLGQIASLSVSYVVEGERKAAFVPQVSFATLVRPGTVRLSPVAVPPHPSSRVRFERVEGALRLTCSNRHDHVDMVCTHTNRVQEPTPRSANLANGAIDALTLLRVKGTWLRLQFAPVAIAPAITSRKVWGLVSIVETVDRPAFVAVEPCAVATKGY
jgi:hypothetical protein